MMITRPTLLLDEARCRTNIESMWSKAARSKVHFRPHFKTHQSLEIGGWFRELGVDKITVSSLEMAKYFAAEWNDITVAFPVNILEIDTINELAGKIHLNLLIESVETTAFLGNQLKYKAGFFIKIDVGYHRTGLSSRTAIDELLNVAAGIDNLVFKGFLTHAGHSYVCRNREEILAVHQESIDKITALKEHFLESHPDLVLSVGDTPTCSVADDFSMFDEIRPGNFVFYDLSQHQIGACSQDQIAVALACPVVAIHDDRNELVIYGGGVHFSKERLMDDQAGEVFGIVAESTENGWGDSIEGMYVRSLSQEHGIVSVPADRIPGYKVGDILTVLPVHSCMTANLMKAYLTTSGRTISRL